MLRSLLVIMFTLCCARAGAEDSERPTGAFNQVDRKLTNEPVYQSTPKYSLLVFGPGTNVRVWMVEDGRRLYVDSNANGDLTDDGPPIQPSNTRNLGDDRWDCNYLLDAIMAADGTRHTEFDLRRWNYGDKDDTYGLSLSLDGHTPMYAGWFGTFWSSKSETAPVVHFGGPLTPRMLGATEFAIGTGRRRLSIAFTNPGSGEGATSRLSIDALPPDVVPKLMINWPVADGTPARATSHALTERCCYWEFYTLDFRVPTDVVVGKAKVSVEISAFPMPVTLTTNEIEVPVIDRSNKKKD